MLEAFFPALKRWASAGLIALPTASPQRVRPVADKMAVPRIHGSKKPKKSLPIAVPTLHRCNENKVAKPVPIQ
jgi:hypothetical protein